MKGMAPIAPSPEPTEPAAWRVVLFAAAVPLLLRAVRVDRLGAWLEPYPCHNLCAKRWYRRSVPMDEVERQRRDLAQCCSHHQPDLHSELHNTVLPDDERWNWRHGESE